MRTTINGKVHTFTIDNDKMEARDEISTAMKMSFKIGLKIIELAKYNITYVNEVFFDSKLYLFGYKSDKTGLVFIVEFDTNESPKSVMENTDTKQEPKEEVSQQEITAQAEVEAELVSKI